VFFLNKRVLIFFYVRTVIEELSYPIIQYIYCGSQPEVDLAIAVPVQVVDERVHLEGGEPDLGVLGDKENGN